MEKKRRERGKGLCFFVDGWRRRGNGTLIPEQGMGGEGGGEKKPGSKDVIYHMIRFQFGKGEKGGTDDYLTIRTIMQTGRRGKGRGGNFS